MRRVVVGLGMVGGIAVIAVAIFLARIYIVGGSGEASAPITAPTLAVAEAGTGAGDTPTPEMPEMMEASPTESAGDPATAAPTPAGGSGGVAQAVAGGERLLYRISPEESEVRFTLSEVLRGVPTTVIGRTNQVAGDIIVDFGAPARSELGVIRINARTLQTDNEFRNRALRSDILQSARDEFEFAQFAPTALVGLPEAVAIGDTVSFQIVGDLTVRDITNQVTFQATVTLAARDRIEGTASTTVTRAAYNLIIPNVPGVAGVSEDVLLAIDFVARAVEG